MIITFDSSTIILEREWKRDKNQPHLLLESKSVQTISNATRIKAIETCSVRLTQNGSSSELKKGKNRSSQFNPPVDQILAIHCRGSDGNYYVIEASGEKSQL